MHRTRITHAYTQGFQIQCFRPRHKTIKLALWFRENNTRSARCSDAASEIKITRCAYRPMNQITKEEIRSTCTELRSILERKKDGIADAGYSFFDQFPRGCCDKATHLLAHYLIHKGLCLAEEMTMPWNNYDMENDGADSHSWISLANGLNIDITADQFHDMNETIIVSNDHPFHQRFTGAEWVGFEENHRRITWHDGGETFNRVWQLIITDLTPEGEPKTA